MKKIVVCGAGTMGGGIAQVSANAGYEVWMYDLTDDFANNGKNKIAAGLEKQVEKGKMTVEQKDALLARLHPTSDINCAADADLIMEAVLENVQVKKDLFAKLEGVCRDDAIIGEQIFDSAVRAVADCAEQYGCGHLLLFVHANVQDA